MEAKKRGSFTGSIGFVLAAAGSAVGLGNIWRFPYLAAKYGGGIFLLVYLILAVTLGFTLMTTEIAIGRKTGKSAIEAYRALDKRFSFLGYLAALVPVIIFPYYCVIGGWVMKYLTVFITGGAQASAQTGFFEDFIAMPVEPLGWLALYVGVTALVVLFGVEKGVEKVSRIMMPVLVILSIVIAVYSITLPGALEGVRYYLIPDFSRFSVTTVLAAMGQMFYSMSLAMGIMITYGSYMKKDTDLEKSVGKIEIFDTGIAFIAGLMVVPAVFALSGGDPKALNQGAGLMFVTLPKVFYNMGQGSFLGTIVGAAFFLLVLFAALTSSISLMETIVSFTGDRLHWSRKKACLIVALVSFGIGIPSSLGYGPLRFLQPLGFSILDFFDFLSNSVLMPVVALITCIFIAYFVGVKTVADEVRLSSKFRREKLFTVVIKYLAPICIILILLSSVLDGLGMIQI